MKKLQRLVIYLSLLAVCSCGTGLRVTVCLSDPGNGGFQCSDAKKNKSFLPYASSENYVALSPDDAETVLNYCKSK